MRTARTTDLSDRNLPQTSFIAMSESSSVGPARLDLRPRQESRLSLKNGAESLPPNRQTEQPAEQLSSPAIDVPGTHVTVGLSRGLLGRFFHKLMNPHRLAEGLLRRLGLGSTKDIATESSQKPPNDQNYTDAALARSGSIHRLVAGQVSPLPNQNPQTYLSARVPGVIEPDRMSRQREDSAIEFGYSVYVHIKNLDGKIWELPVLVDTSCPKSFISRRTCSDIGPFRERPVPKEKRNTYRGMLGDVVVPHSFIEVLLNFQGKGLETMGARLMIMEGNDHFDIILGRDFITKYSKRTKTSLLVVVEGLTDKAATSETGTATIGALLSGKNIKAQEVVDEEYQQEAEQNYKALYRGMPSSTSVLSRMQMPVSRVRVPVESARFSRGSNDTSFQDSTRPTSVDGEDRFLTTAPEIGDNESRKSLSKLFELNNQGGDSTENRGEARDGAHCTSDRPVVLEPVTSERIVAWRDGLRIHEDILRYPVDANGPLNSNFASVEKEDNTAGSNGDMYGPSLFAIQSVPQASSSAVNADQDLIRHITDTKSKFPELYTVQPALSLDDGSYDRLEEVYTDTMELVILPFCTEFLWTLVGNEYIISHDLVPHQRPTLVFITPKPPEINVCHSIELYVREMLPNVLKDLTNVSFLVGESTQIAAQRRCSNSQGCSDYSSIGCAIYADNYDNVPSTMTLHLTIGGCAVTIVCNHAFMQCSYGSDGALSIDGPLPDGTCVLHGTEMVGRLRSEHSGTPTVYSSWPSSNPYFEKYDKSTQKKSYMRSDWRLVETAPDLCHKPMIIRDFEQPCPHVLHTERPLPKMQVRYKGATTQVVGKIAPGPADTISKPAPHERTNYTQLEVARRVRAWRIIPNDSQESNEKGCSEEPLVDRKGDSGAPVTDLQNRVLGMVIEEAKGHPQRGIYMSEILDTLDHISSVMVKRAYFANPADELLIEFNNCCCSLRDPEHESLETVRHVLFTRSAGVESSRESYALPSKASSSVSTSFELPGMLSSSSLTSFEDCQPPKAGGCSNEAVDQADMTHF
ncbi:hypothetical protein BGZ57DRAFT_264434 [Hyaloscypha finlandica]|nr:hypothetical protein BGZ57DRAFT_264434 [Hyaloscypha finlandica]